MTFRDERHVADDDTEMSGVEIVCWKGIASYDDVNDQALGGAWDHGTPGLEGTESSFIIQGRASGDSMAPAKKPQTHLDAWRLAAVHGMLCLLRCVCYAEAT